MGLFTFLKDVGEKIFGGGEAKAEELKKSLDAHGLDAKDIQVQVDGDQVVLKGSVKDQATLEKVVLAVGNNVGVAGVKTDDIAVSTPAEESVFIPSNQAIRFGKLPKHSTARAREINTISSLKPIPPC